MVLGTPTTFTSCSYRRVAAPRVSSPPIAISASTPSPARLSLIRSTPLRPAPPALSASGVVLDEPRIVPPRGRIPRTACTSRGIVSPSRGPRQPSRNPTNSYPNSWAPRRTSARITAFSPGQSPPPVSTPTRIGATLVPMSVLAIDAGTTGVTALVIAADGGVDGRGYQEFRQYYPQPGWVEHLTAGICRATLTACAQALASARSPGQDQEFRTNLAQPVSSIGITNQRETAVVWDREPLAAPRRAIVWQDRRTARLCDRLRQAGHEDRIRELTGLRIDPYFTATKVTWLAEHDHATWQGIADGSLAVGTVDSYLIARLTGGRRHVTDASNASRTMLFDIGAGQWSAELCELLQVPRRGLPEVVPSTGVAAHTAPAAFLGMALSIAGIPGAPH